MTAHRGLWLSESLADRRYAVSLYAGCAVRVRSGRELGTRARAWALTQGLEALVY